MSESLRHSFEERRYGLNRAIGAPDSPFRSHLALEENQPSQIYPRTSGQRPQLMLPLASVAGHVVPFVLLGLRDVVHPFPGPHRFQLLRQEVPPLVLGAVSRIGYAERSASGPLGFIDFAGPCVSNSDRISITLVQCVFAMMPLNTGEHPIHIKRPVVGALVGPVAIDHVHLRAGSGLALGNGSFVEGVVRSRGPFHLYAGDESRSFFPHTQSLSIRKYQKFLRQVIDSFIPVLFITRP